jgi:ATP-dependent HslUV protease ATP-binding subunit HslU
LTAAQVMIREHMREEVKTKAHDAAEERVIEALGRRRRPRPDPGDVPPQTPRMENSTDTIIELEVADTSNPMQGFEIPGQPPGMPWAA